MADFIGPRVIFRDLGLDKVLQGLTTLDKSRVRVGVVGEAANRPSSDGRETLGEVAFWNEFGTKTAPPRPFIHPTFHEESAREASIEVAQAILSFENTDQALGKAGEKIAQSMRDKIIRDELQPRNAARTIKRKGFDHPLFEVGGLQDAIGHEIVRGDGGEVASIAGELKEAHIDAD